MTTKDKRVWAVVAIIYAVGLVGFMVPALHDLFVWLIPFNILFAFAVLCLGEERFTRSDLLLFTVCFVFGFVYEWAGTSTGVIFGEYAYGRGLGIKLWNVPVLIGLNWFFMVYASLALTGLFVMPAWQRLLLAPACMLVYDFFLEPFAIRNDMWTWQATEVPLQNYVAWYAGGLVLCAFAVWGRFEIRNRYAVGLFGIQILFFLLLEVYASC